MKAAFEVSELYSAALVKSKIDSFGSNEYARCCIAFQLTCLNVDESDARHILKRIAKKTNT